MRARKYTPPVQPNKVLFMKIIQELCRNRIFFYKKTQKTEKSPNKKEQEKRDSFFPLLVVSTLDVCSSAGAPGPTHSSHAAPEDGFATRRARGEKTQTAAAPNSSCPLRRRRSRLACSSPAMPSVNTVANGPTESPEAAALAAPKTSPSPAPAPAAATTKGRGLRRWRRIRRDKELPRESTGGGGDSPNGKHDASAAAQAEAESSTASVESRLVTPPPPRSRPGLGFSVGEGNSEDGSSRSSTAAPAPRVPLPRCDLASVVLSPREHERERERDRPRPRAAAASISTEAGCSRSSVESDLRRSNAVKARQQLGAPGLNGVRKVFHGCCGYGDEDQLSHEVRSTGRCRWNGGSVVSRSVWLSAGEESVGNGGNGRMYWGAADPCNESILVLQRAQEALENGMVKLSICLFT